MIQARLQRGISLICFLWGAGGGAMSSETWGSILPELLSFTNNCPNTPKPTCDDSSCQGIIDMTAGSIFAKYTCSNQSPVYLLGRHIPAILAHCRCCPRVPDVSCAHSACAAAADTFVCQAEALRGCACQTHDPLEDETEEAVQDLSSQHLRPPPQPDVLPPYSGPTIIELLRVSPLRQRFSVINDTLFESTEQAEVGVLQSTLGVSIDREEDQGAPGLQPNRSSEIHTGLGLYRSPQPTLFLVAKGHLDQSR
jgi:hypothetical protein